MKRSFSNEQQDAFLKAIDTGKQSVGKVRRSLTQCINDDDLVDGDWNEFRDYMQGISDELDSFREDVVKVHEDAEQWDINTHKKLEENNLELLKYNQGQLALIQCMRPLDNLEIKYYPPEVISENLANIETFKQQGYYSALLIHYNENRRWETIFTKNYNLITDEEWLAIALMQGYFEHQKNWADLTLLNQYIGAKELEEANAQPTSWKYVDTLKEEFKDDPSVSRFVNWMTVGVPEACDDIFGKNKDGHLIRNAAESITVGSVELVGLAGSLLEYGGAGVVKGLDHIPGVEKLIGDAAADWSDRTIKEFHTGVADTIEGIGYAIDHPKETADAIGGEIKHSFEERGIDGALIYFAGESAPGIITGTAAVKGVQKVNKALGVTAKLAKSAKILSETKTLKPVFNMAEQMKTKTVLMKEILEDSKVKLQNTADDIARGMSGEKPLLAGAGGMNITMKEAEKLISVTSDVSLAGTGLGAGGTVAKEAAQVFDDTAKVAAKKSDDLIKGVEGGKIAGELDATGSKFNVTPEIERHIINRQVINPKTGEPYSNQKGVVGAHNAEEFAKCDIKIVGQTNIYDIHGNEVSWAKNIEYQMPKLDMYKQPVPGEYSAKIHDKTVYDPKLMNSLSRAFSPIGCNYFMNDHIQKK